MKATTLILAGAAGMGAWWALRRRSSYDLRDKVVLVTGASRGLGLVLARQFAAEGSRLAICARNADDLERARADLGSSGTHFLALPCDLTVPTQVRDLVHTVTEHFGRIDVLVNNAGTIQVGPAEEMTLRDFEEAMRANFWAALYAIHAVLPDMRRRHAGRIVNITSIGGKIAVPHLLPYSASKFALVGLSEGLRAELAKDGVCVTTVVPGLMRTGSPRNALFKGQHRTEYTLFALSDSLPPMAMGAERTARRIVTACRRGEAEVILTVAAKLAVRIEGLFPGLTADALGLVNRVLPGPGGIGTSRAKGKESETVLAPSVLTTLSDRAARRNNEMAPTHENAGAADELVRAADSANLSGQGTENRRQP